MATVTGLDVELARDLIARKMTGQRANLARLRVADLSSFDAMRAALDRADSIDDVRLCEAKAAAIYWNAWSNVPIRLRGRDLAKVPARWARYDARSSALTGAPRAATNPVNALLNFTYSLLETESRLALLGAGLDPTLGVLHADQRNRDSFALDAMEPIRPAVDAFVLDLLEERVLTARDFAELPNGVCRVRAPLTHELALTLPQWRLLLGPIVTDLAKRFRAALLDRGRATGGTRAAVPRETRELTRSVPGTAESPRTKSSRRRGSTSAGSRVGPVPVARDAAESTAGAPVREQGVERAAPGSAGIGSRRVRDVRRPGPQAAAPVLRGVPAASAPRARDVRDSRGAQGAGGADPRRRRSAQERAGWAQTRRRRFGRAAAQPRLGARESKRRARSRMVRARGGAEAGRLSPKRACGGHEVIADGLLAHPFRRTGAHPRHWGALLGLVEETLL